MLIKALTNGRISGTGTAIVASGMLGAVLISTDGTNAAVVTVQRNDASGKAVFSISTKTPLFVAGPISLEEADVAYYSITGTGAAAQLYEWIN
jgi:hypothetical protein